jgi:hypothetical protein
MTDTNIDETARNLSQSVSETNQAVIRGAVEAQERNMRFAQGIFDSGIEVLRQHAEATQKLMQTLATPAQSPEETLQAIKESTAQAQERNVRFAQNVVESGTEVFKSHVEATRTLMQDVIEKTREQEELLLTLPYVDAYMNMFRDPLVSYKQAVETAQALTKHAMEVAQRSAQQGWEVAQHFAQQGANAAQSATHHEQQ